MSQEELENKLLSDLVLLNLPVYEVDLKIRPYSKSFYGRYFPVVDEKKTRPRIFIYPYENESGDLMNYKDILDTAIHEFCHHIQYASGYIRKRGVMHNTHFWKLYNHYITRANKLDLFGGSK